MTTPLIQPTGGGRLDVSGSARFTAQGRAEIVLGPVPARRVWAVTRIAVSATGPNNPMPECSVYEGAERPAQMIDTTWTGTQDVSDFGTPYELEDGDFLTFVWTGGTPNETATARLIGRQYLLGS